jgi:hypothetical protein
VRQRQITFFVWHPTYGQEEEKRISNNGFLISSAFFSTLWQNILSKTALGKKESVIRRTEIMKLIIVLASLMTVLALVVMGLSWLIARRSGHSGPANDWTVPFMHKTAHVYIAALSVSLKLHLSCGWKMVYAAEIQMKETNLPPIPTLLFLLFDSVNAFGDFLRPSESAPILVRR